MQDCSDMVMNQYIHWKWQECLCWTPLQHVCGEFSIEIGHVDIIPVNWITIGMAANPRIKVQCRL